MNSAPNNFHTGTMPALRPAASETSYTCLAGTALRPRYCHATGVPAARLISLTYNFGFSTYTARICPDGITGARLICGTVEIANGVVVNTFTVGELENSEDFPR